MTDERQRELERQASSGDVQAEVKLLLERVRAGELTEDQLRLAAFLGHEPAGSALGSEPATFFDLDVFDRQLLKAGAKGIVRTAIALAYQAREEATLLGGNKALASANDALFSAEGWVLSPDREHADQCRLGASAVRRPQKAHHRFWARLAAELVVCAPREE